jgi:hypothetical protein
MSGAGRGGISRFARRFQSTSRPVPVLSKRRGRRLIARVPLGPLLVLPLVASLACSSAPGEPGGEIAVRMVPASSSGAAKIHVAGLSGTELTALSALNASADNWPGILKVTVVGQDIPVAGRYVLGSDALEFHPAFPFDPGRPYAVAFDAGRLGTARRPSVVEAVVSLPPPPDAPAAVVSAIHPSATRWPENLLRFYVHFSAPMSADIGGVHLVADDGEDVPDALLPATVDLWNEDRTRYTVLFDPGRVKRGILPNRQMGRALVAGRQYAIVVDGAWRDANGRPLASRFRHEFTAGPPLERALDTKSWRVQPPDEGTRTPLVITFPTLLDRALLLRTIRVESDGGDVVQGEVGLGSGETEWRFTPERPWSRAASWLVVSGVLEDPSGNRINRAFEIDPAKAPEAPEAEEFRIRFAVRSR